MKISNFFAGLLIGSLVILNSCEVTKEDTKTTNLTYELDGVKFDGSSTAVHYQSITGGQVIYSKVNDTTTILITVPVLEPGTFTSADTTLEAGISFIFSNGDNTDMYSSDMGSESSYTITIGSYDKGTTVLEGTFSGKVGDMFDIFDIDVSYLAVTNGEFTVRLK